VNGEPEQILIARVNEFRLTGRAEEDAKQEGSSCHALSNPALSKPLPNSGFQHSPIGPHRASNLDRQKRTQEPPKQARST
jgi:hypothetical protein